MSKSMEPLISLEKVALGLRSTWPVGSVPCRVLEDMPAALAASAIKTRILRSHWHYPVTDQGGAQPVYASKITMNLETLAHFLAPAR
jgi:hypothetical protein